MLNSEMIRINSLAEIVKEGHIIRLSSNKKLPDKWKQLAGLFVQQLASHISDKKKSEQVRLLHSNNLDKCSIQIPAAPEFPNMSSTLRFCQAASEPLMTDHPDTKLTLLVSRTDLEQTFLSYAAHQKQHDKDKK